MMHLSVSLDLSTSGVMMVDDVLSSCARRARCGSPLGSLAAAAAAACLTLHTSMHVSKRSTQRSCARALSPLSICHTQSCSQVAKYTNLIVRIIEIDDKHLI